MTGARRSSGRGSGSLDHWEVWWEYNRDALIDLRASIEAGRPVSGSSGFFGRKAVGPVAAGEALDEAVLPVLWAALKSPEAEVRNAAVLAVAKIGGPWAITMILPFLADGDRSVREAAVLGLGVRGDPRARDVLVALLLDDSEGRRLRGREVESRLRSLSAIALGLLKDPTAAGPLIETMNGEHRSPDVPASAAIALGLIGNPDERTVWALLKVLGDARRPAVLRAHAVNAIGKMLRDRSGDLPRGVREGLDQALSDRNAEVRRSAVLATGLVARADDRIAARLLAAHEDEADSMARYFAAIGLGRVGGEPARKALEGGLRSGNMEVRAFSAIGLALLTRGTPDPANRASLARVLDVFRSEKVDCVKGAMAIALGLGRHEPARATVLEALARSGDPFFQGFACVGLGLLGARDAQPTVLELFRGASGRPILQREAAVALSLLGSRDATRELLPALHKGSTTWSLGTVSRVLGLTGDPTAIPSLTAIVQDGSFPTLSRAYAVVALGSLCEDRALPVRAVVSSDLNYRAAVETLETVLATL
jgi:HEAT repeat protein